LLYSLVLTLVLVASIIYLRSLEQTPRQPADKVTTLRERPAPRSTMGIQSAPAERSTMDAESVDETNRDALYETGVEMLALWHVPEATSVFESMARDGAGDSDVFLRLVECYADPSMGDEKRARENLELARAVAMDDGGDTLRVTAYEKLFVENRNDEATRLFDQIEFEDGDVEGRFLLALALFRDGELTRAERQLVDLLDGDPTLSRVRELLVLCKVAQGDEAAADQLARDLAAIYPGEPYPYVLLSRVKLLIGDTAAAVDFSNNALQMDPRYVPAILARADLFVSESHLEAARVSYEKLLLFSEPLLASVGREGLAYVDFLSGRFEDGRDQMEEAIREAMSAGATRRGLYLSFRLMDYLCELGRIDAAEAVMDRWVVRHGNAPDLLGKLRIALANGDVATTRHALDRIHGNPEWLARMRGVGMDYDDIRALTYIKENDFQGALDVLAAADGLPSVRHAYLEGFALFRTGQAEDAAQRFAEARARLPRATYPYDRDPVLHVQSIFYQAETALARGDREAAADYYKEFLAMWGESEWGLQAVKRAQDKLAALAPPPIDD